MRFNPMAMMGNNPVMQLVNSLKNGGNPNDLVNSILDNHPQRQQLMQIIGGKSPDQLMKVAENMCKERGTTIEEVLKSFGISK